MLNMMRECGLTSSLDSLAQAWQTESGRKRSTEAGLVDEPKRRLLSGDAAGRYPTKMAITVVFENLCRDSGHTRAVWAQLEIHRLNRWHLDFTQLREFFVITTAPSTETFEYVTDYHCTSSNRIRKFRILPTGKQAWPIVSCDFYRGLNPISIKSA